MDKNKVTNEKRLLTKKFTLKESFCLLQALKKITILIDSTKCIPKMTIIFCQIIFY